ncbi:hypothetical protein F5887DRAFT_638563 [Amanita rubescens]|nr:hypothetical protein F5887DRAFT_638563 [Amanita rubescens]
MAADAPTPTPSNNPEQAKDDSPNVDTFQKPTGSPGPTSHTNVDHSDSEQPQQHDDYPADPQVAALRAIFPDYDDGLLLSVLQSVEGDQDRAIDALLGMSDPQYKSEPSGQQGGQAHSQVDLDEQLARRLMLEEQQQHALPYQPYNGPARRGYRPQPPRDAPPEKDTVSDIQDQISRFAESGKKTFESLFSKVKAKIQEYDKPAGSKEPEAPNLPSWGAEPSPGASKQRWSYNSGSQQQPLYHEPTPSVTVVPSSSSALTGKPVHPYDIGVEQDAGTSVPLKTEPISDVASPRMSIGSRPITTIDGGKLGLLPKRPVSLLKPQVAAAGQTESERQTSLDDDDELEYAENPFEDSRS